MSRPWIATFAPVMALLAGCAATPDVPDPPRVRAGDDIAAEALMHAKAMLGKPYRSAGDTPAGFDCSGLVKYSYGRAGISLPRDTQSQRRMSVRVSSRSLREGDLLFFDQEGKKTSHVGLYLGNRRFIHAPSSGGKVRTDSLDAEYWKKHFVEARRI